MKTVYHRLKTWPKHFQAIMRGDKTFEIRKNDRGFKSFDYLVLEEWNPDTEEYTGRVLIRMVGTIIEGEWGIPNGICVMSLLRNYH
jgi:hypothetical protein